MSVKMMKNQDGFSLMEILVSMAIVGILSTSVAGALSTAHKTNIAGNEMTTAESVARSQMDYVQNQPYDTANATPVYAVLSDLPSGYSIVTPMAVRLDPKDDGTANDDGLQQITVTVKRGTEIVYTLIDFKNNLTP
jgi:prepilin-type N-terminal cleavage/methylation domain-containing protein